MKTLFERLSKENQEKINNYELIYIKESVLEALEKEYFHDLTVRDATCLCDIFLCGYDILRLRQIFNNN